MAQRKKQTKTITVNGNKVKASCYEGDLNWVVEK